jgi:predicted chitinase
MRLYTGCVENREDPLKIGRCQVRIVGLHTENKAILPTKDLPWAHPMAPVTSASMNGIGWTPVGPVNGTWVVIMFTDDEQQQPLMLGTLPGIPQSKAAEIAVEESDDQVIVTDGGLLTDSSGQPILSGDGTPVQIGNSEATRTGTTPASPTNLPNLTEQKTPNKPTDTVLKADITTVPPPKSTTNSLLAQQNIQHIIDACDQVGLTSKYAKCAILGICGGESGWLAIEEGSYYSNADSLAKIFRKSFPGGAAEAQPFTKWQGTKADFFRKIYSPTGNGSLLGHKDSEDGAKYYGRGFNQITGKSLYQQLQKFLTSKGIVVDIVNNPDSLIADPKVAALATAAFYSLNVRADQNDPSYFTAALKRTGADANGTGYKKKEKYYEYFLGADVAVSSTNKPAADESVTYTKEEVKDLPPAKQVALLEDRTSNSIVGFNDPKGKYPLRNLLDEPDTNRLARGVLKETAIEFKDSLRAKDIPAANGADSWNQPLAPFGGMYPYNKVYESESGHLLVFDDTPNNENISLYHRTGTSLDIDGNGTQVNRIVGDGYTIIDRNGAIFITGKCNLTVGNSVNILVQGTADIQIDGETNININNNANLGIAGDLDLAVGGDFNLNVAGTHNITANTINQYSKTNIIAQANNNVEVRASGSINETASSMNISADIYNETVGSSNYRWEGDKHVYTGGNTYSRHASGSDLSCPADPSRGSGVDCSNVSSATESTSINPLTLEAPEFADAKLDQFQHLTTPVRPSPPIQLKYAIAEENEALVADYIANPDKYLNKEAAADGVKPNFAGTPKDDGQGKSLIAGGNTSDIAAFLEKQLQATAQTNYWRETGQAGADSNINITRIWADLGYPKQGMWLSDQTAWCMGFVNWTLKQCGYRYVQTASAKAIAANPEKWGATKVSVENAEPGDIVLWNYSHVNFVYRNTNGKLSFVGGNQSPSKGGNNPNDGDVTNSWPAGWNAARGGIIGIFRPSKV